MQSIKAVLFDLDDTLWPIVPVIIRAETVLFDWLRRHAPAVASRHSIHSLRERRKEMMETNPRYRFDLWALRHAVLAEAFVGCGEEASLADQAMAIFDRERNRVGLYEDVRPALERLGRKVRLGSISNGPADLEAIGLAHHFEVSIAAHRFGRAKPDPAIFHAACEALGIAPEQAAYVGDDPLIDVEGAKNAGLRAVWINRAGVEPARVLPDHVHPDAVCATLDELEDWVDAHRSGNR